MTNSLREDHPLRDLLERLHAASEAQEEATLAWMRRDGGRSVAGTEADVPTLCRITCSSVFGGIAARNTGYSAVRLEQRIAVGDPECHVTVMLRPAPGQPEDAHLYGVEPDETAEVTRPMPRRGQGEERYRCGNWSSGWERSDGSRFTGAT